MSHLPKHTTCGHCNHRVKLKNADWELWTEDDKPVGMSQQRECYRCHSRVLAALGDPEFVAVLMKHFGDEPLH